MIIHITGSTGEGKTVVAMLIEEMLKEHGIQTTITEIPEGDDIELARTHKDRFVKALVDKHLQVAIGIQTHQTIRPRL